jgi:hypothetical protein
MQPQYVTLSSSGSSPWRQTDWDAEPQQIAFAVIAASGSSWAIGVTFEDISGTYPSPVSSSPTSFTLLAGSTTQFVTVGASMAPIAGYRFSLNAPSTVSASVTFVVMQSGTG